MLDLDKVIPALALLVALALVGSCTVGLIVGASL